MILGMTPLTFIHVVVSLIAIGTGLLALRAMIAGEGNERWTGWFLVTTALTSITGFVFFQFTTLLPSHIVGIISLIVLTVAFYARYGTALDGVWRPAYVIAATIALYFNVFVLVAQLFMKFPPLRALAPTQAEPPFALAQAIVLAVFVWLGIRAVKGYRAPKTLAV
jgi:hypothetical protein